MDAHVIMTRPNQSQYLHSHSPLSTRSFLHPCRNPILKTTEMVSSTDTEFTGWACDDITPNLCELETVEGSVMIRGVEVHYWKYSLPPSKNSELQNSVSSSSSLLFPIIALHGGPGWPHNYMLPLKQQACHGRVVYFYDQAGCGRSILPAFNGTVEKDYPWLLTTEYYSEQELPILLDHWGIHAEGYHIIGNSWGTVLAQLFALNAENVPSPTSMVLSGPFSDSQFYIQSQWNQQDGTLGSLPPYVQERIHRLEKDRNYDTIEYQQIDDILTMKFTCRTAPLPDCFLSSSTHYNPEIYVGMQGASEFTMAGTLGDFNSTPRLHELTMPVLLTHGQYDTMRPAVVKLMEETMPLAERLFLLKSAHVSMIDEPETMNDAIANFFHRVEAARASNQPFIPNKSSSSSNGHVQHTTIPTGHNQHSSLLTLVLAITIAFCLGALFGWRLQIAQRRKDYAMLG